MRKTIALLQRFVLSRPRSADDAGLSPFDRRLKQINRARVVNQQGLGGPVFRYRRSQKAV